MSHITLKHGRICMAVGATTTHTRVHSRTHTYKHTRYFAHVSARVSKSSKAIVSVSISPTPIDNQAALSQTRSHHNQGSKGRTSTPRPSCLCPASHARRMLAMLFDTRPVFGCSGSRRNAGAKEGQSGRGRGCCSQVVMGRNDVGETGARAGDMPGSRNRWRQNERASKTQDWQQNAHSAPCSYFIDMFPPFSPLWQRLMFSRRFSSIQRTTLFQLDVPGQT